MRTSQHSFEMYIFHFSKSTECKMDSPNEENIIKLKTENFAAIEYWTMRTMNEVPNQKSKTMNDKAGKWRYSDIQKENGKILLVFVIYFCLQPKMLPMNRQKKGKGLKEGRGKWNSKNHFAYDWKLNKLI